MVTTSSMATRSSLELMLDKLQQLEEQPAATPPALPVRPVSRARLPRPRRPLQLDPDSRIADQYLTRVRTKCLIIESEKSKEKEICKIQKCYRGHQARCCYEEMRKGIVPLQSYIRGEIARTGYQHTMQTQLRSYLHHQSGNRGGLDRRRPNQIKLEVEDAEDQNLVSYESLVDLQKRLMTTEAKLRGKEEENTELKRKLMEIEKKWRQYEERMKSMEKEWQDQLTYIQECLATGKRNSSGRINLDIPMNSNHVDEGEAEERIWAKLRPDEQLRKLKLRFKAWKKEYTNKLRDAQSSFRKLGINPQTANSYKNWWGRLSH